LHDNNYLAHHGILGQKWGKRNGPPYPLKGGSYSRSEEKAIIRDRDKNRNSIYNKRHYDKMIGEGTVLKTLSFDKDRTKNTDIFFATYEQNDIDRYRSRFNQPWSPWVKDENGNVIGVDISCKWDVRNAAKHDIKVASEDAGAKAFMDLWEKDRDFYNFVMDPERMDAHPYAGKRHQRFEGFRDAENTLHEIQNGRPPTEKDLHTIYRLFNYAAPLSDDTMDKRMANDVKRQQLKFTKELKRRGYGAMLDVNDSMYGGLKANAPVIVFDMDALIPQEAKQTTIKDLVGSTLLDKGREFLGVYDKVDV
jgi:hypothetical protein